jgi:lipopolysaccharide transport system permease protein
VNALPHIILQPSRGWAPLRLGELWEFRDLLYFLIWRDVKVRYKQTVLGVAWAVLQPVLSMVIFTLIFGKLVGVRSDGLPYPLFCYAALAPWQFFAQALAQSSNSVVTNARLLQKVYFPRLILPLAAVLAGVVDFLLALAVLAGLMFWYGLAPSPWAVLWLPLLALWIALVALGVGVWFAALNVQFRDVFYVVPFVIQIWFFCTPVVYPASLAPENWRWLTGLNPMTGVVEGFRAGLLGVAAAFGPALALSACMTLAILLGGLVYFRRVERTFADVV